MSVNPLDQPWPAAELEDVKSCPFCQKHPRTLAYQGVQGWALHCAPGSWTYWDCNTCQSLYLSPRPTPESIAHAYKQYYTHADAQSASRFQRLKTRLRNECFSQRLQANIEPRLHLPHALQGVIRKIGQRVILPFGGLELASSPRGRFLDVGCGAGQVVKLAQQLGWQAMGLEMDPLAVKMARKNGLEILQGRTELLLDFEDTFDCIMCSHVLEHVHQPQELLVQLKNALKPGGMLLMILPNSLSALRQYFGAHWRGLEAPRHLAIPSEPALVSLLEELGFSVKSLADARCETAAESYRIQRRSLVLNKADSQKARRLDINPLATPHGNDFIKLVCRLSASST